VNFTRSEENKPQIGGAKKEAKQEEVKADNSEKINSLFDTIGKFDATTQTADDLKKISGVGPKLEGVLNEIGIFTFVQVSPRKSRKR